MLYFKIILALLLSAIPFLFKHFILPKRESSPACRNAITAAASAMPYFKRWRRKYFNISIRIYNAMKHSIEARKFFTLLMLLVLLTITMVDFNASATIARKVTKAAQECGNETETLIGLYSVYAPYLTFRYATVLAGLMVVPFFSYRLTDRILMKLAGSKHFFCTVSALAMALFAICAFHSSGRNIVIIEIIYVILGAASIYPRYRQTTAQVHAVSKGTLDRLYRIKYCTMEDCKIGQMEER